MLDGTEGVGPSYLRQSCGQGAAQLYDDAFVLSICNVLLSFKMQHR